MPRERRLSLGHVSAVPAKRHDAGSPAEKEARRAGTAAGAALQQQANGAFRQGHHDEALALFSQALDAWGWANAPMELFSNRSAVLCKLGRYAEALQDADRAVQINPKWGRGHSRRGNALHSMCLYDGANRRQEAREAYTEALRLDPENAIVQGALKGLVAEIEEEANSHSQQAAGS